MDQIQEIVCKQLSAVHGIESVQLQNHIYGCFVVMEDIAEKKIVVENDECKGTNYTFHLDNQFSQIGIRYGFAMDTKLMATTCLPEYKAAWLTIFKSVLSLEQVDQIEDGVIESIRTCVVPDLAFFLHALDTGTLPQEWINKLLSLLLEPSVEPVVKPSIEGSILKSILSEKPKKFRVTKRHPVLVTKFLGKTRRNKK
jgi:hypothetical protein